MPSSINHIHDNLVQYPDFDFCLSPDCKFALFNDSWLQMSSTVTLFIQMSSGFQNSWQVDTTWVRTCRWSDFEKLLWSPMERSKAAENTRTYCQSAAYSTEDFLATPLEDVHVEPAFCSLFGCELHAERIKKRSQMNQRERVVRQHFFQACGQCANRLAEKAAKYNKPERPVQIVY